ncbi:MAG TPA: HIT domain-containing protein [Candidatus Nanoarchaeia archaeon]|nr:HIT domain-containing protein [Candidatus Nanoarchaeia archaeon]
MNCTFCSLPEIKERIIIQNKLAFAFPTNIPIVPGHVLICPKRCISRIDQLSKEEFKAIFDLLLKIRTGLISAFAAKGFNYAWNEGAIAGQNVPHLHLHLLPRKEGDAGITEYEPRKFLYRPGSREATPEAELKDVAKLIKENFWPSSTKKKDSFIY